MIIEKSMKPKEVLWLLKEKLKEKQLKEKQLKEKQLKEKL